MLIKRSRLCKELVAVLLTFAMVNLFVLMGARTTRASTNATPEISSSLLVGRLALADQQAIFVNGNEARTGTTIFSGMRLQSPVGVNAAVQLGALGNISLEQNTDLTLDFSSGRVAVTVSSGDATLTTKDGVVGSITAADGKVLNSNGSKAAVLSTNASAAAAKMSSKKKAGIWIAVAAAVIIIIIVIAVSDNESP